MPRRKLTVYVLTFNEESKIRECLESVKWADELIVADSFSTDNTLGICREYGAKVIQIEFKGFGDLRNKAVSHASNEWVLSIDADERATPEIKEEIFKLLESGPAADAYYVPRKTHFMGKWIKHCGWYPDYRQPQFFNKNKMKYTEQLVHETYILDGKIGYLSEHVLQFPFRDLSQYLSKMDRYSTLRAKEMNEAGKRFSLANLIINPFAMFLRMYCFKLGFLDGVRGLIISCLYYYYTMIKYVKLFEIGLKNES